MVQGSNPLASALGSILKRKNSLKGSKSPKSPKKSTSDSPRSTPKSKKKDSLGTPDSPSVSKGFFGSLRRSGSRSSGRKKGKIGSISATASANASTEDLRDNSSIVSMPIHPSPRTEEPLITSTPVKQQEQRQAVSPTHQSSIGSTSFKDHSYMSPVREGPRDSAIFREPSVERLFDTDSSNLFGSSELEAFFKKEKEKTPERTVPESKEVESKKTEVLPTTVIADKSPIARQSESKSNIISRLSAYERGSVNDNNTQSLPGVKEGNKEEQKDSNVRQTESAKIEPKDIKKEKITKKKEDKPSPKTPEKKKSDDFLKKEPTKKADDLFQKDLTKKSSLFDDVGEDDDLFGPVSKTPVLSSEPTTTQSDNDKKKESLLEDELFQEDIKLEPAVKKEPPKVVPKKPKKLSESSPKRETNKPSSPKPSEIIEKKPTPTETNSDEVKEVPKKEEKKSSLFDEDSDLPAYGLRRKSNITKPETETKQVPVIEQVVPKTKETAPKKSTSIFDDEESDLPAYGLRRKKRSLFGDQDQDTSPPIGRQRQTQKKMKEVDSPASSQFTDIETSSSDKTTAEVAKETVSEDKTLIELESEKREKEKEAAKEARSKSPGLFDEDKSKDTVTKDTVEEANESPSIKVKEPTPEKDTDKEVTKAPKETVKTEGRRDRSATELGTSATGWGVRGVTEKKSEKTAPLWVSELKKKRETGEKSTSSTTSTKTSTKSTTEDGDVPEWQKRVIERRKNKSALADKKKETTSSPKTGRLSTKTETQSTARSKSPSSSRKSPISSRSPKTEQQKSTVTDRKSRFDREKDLSKSVEVTSSRRTTTRKTSPAKQAENTKPVLAKKPSIEVTKKIILSSSKSPHSSTTSPRESTTSPRGSTISPEPINKDSKQKTGEDDEVFVEEKPSIEKGVRNRTPSPKLSVDLISNVLDKGEVDGPSSDTVAKEDNTTREKGVCIL